MLSFLLEMIMARTIFYSWQNDLEKKTHRNFIENCLKAALRSLEKDARIYMEYDRDINGVNGSPDITTTIFDKIDKSVLFVCDVSIINSDYNGRKTPNPNVLMELGYAANKLGWDRIICLFDINTGTIEELPFDLRQKRITTYDANKKDELTRISKILSINIKDLYVKGKLFNPLNDYVKGKIDRLLLETLKPFANILYSTISMSEGLSNVSSLLNCKMDEIEEKIKSKQFPAFLVLNDFLLENSNLQEILKDLFSSSYFPKEWSYTVLELMDWIREYNWFISERNKEYPFVALDTKNYNNLAPVNAHSINKSNPQNSFLILETTDKDGHRYVDTKGGKVINQTHYPVDSPLVLKETFCVKEKFISTFSQKIYKLIKICLSWLEITDSEFILDPDFYVIN